VIDGAGTPLAVEVAVQRGDNEVMLKATLAGAK